MATRGAKKRLQNIFKQWNKEYDYSIPTEEWRDAISPDTGDNTNTNGPNGAFIFGHPGKLGKKVTKKLSKSQKRKLKKEAQRAGKSENRGAGGKEKKKEKSQAGSSSSQASKASPNTNGKKGTKNVSFPDNCASVVGTADDYDRTPSMDIPSFFCDGCGGAMSIIDQRFHCTKCPDYDLCPACFSLLAQSHLHPFNCVTPTLDEDGEIMAEIDENIQAGDTEGEFTAEDEQEMREAFLNEYLASADPEELGIDMDLFKNGLTSSLSTDDRDDDGDDGEDEDSSKLGSLAGLAGLGGSGEEDGTDEDGTDEIRTEFMFERTSSVKVEEITDEEFSRLLALEKAKVESKEGEPKGVKKKLAKKAGVLIPAIAPKVTEEDHVLFDSAGEATAMTTAEGEGDQKNTQKRNRKQKAPTKKQPTTAVMNGGRKNKKGSGNANNNSEKQEENKGNKKNNKKRKNNNDNKTAQNQKNSRQKINQNQDSNDDNKSNTKSGPQKKKRKKPKKTQQQIASNQPTSSGQKKTEDKGGMNLDELFGSKIGN